MKVILLTNVPKLGKTYDVKDVSEGYARNFLIPQKKAEVATVAKIASIDEMRKKHESKATESRVAFANHIKALDGKKLTLTEKANDMGHLFAAIHKPEIVAAIKEQLGADIEAGYIMSDETIKEIGDHVIEIGDKEAKATITLTVTKADE
ncbi:MAG: 50S ribosomal protein L9 [Candidatus Yonathbacteria bacterium]|nr:50S ribosomal protein L9 [Candidatus Yonathbacteria bacterium]